MQCAFQVICCIGCLCWCVRVYLMVQEFGPKSVPDSVRYTCVRIRRTPGGVDFAGGTTHLLVSHKPQTGGCLRNIHVNV